MGTLPCGEKTRARPERSEPRLREGEITAEAASLEDNLAAMERSRESYWLRHPSTAPLKLRWRATTVRHSFHVLPGESILEIGAGSGLWTEHLSTVLRGENVITAGVFNDDFANEAKAKRIPNTNVVLIRSLERDLEPESFDYVVGTAVLCHDRYEENLRALWRLLKPGGQLLFFEANYWNPQVLVKVTVPAIGRWAGHPRCQIGLRKYRLLQVASRQGFVEIEIIPYDILHPATPRRMVPMVQSLAFLLEHVPGVREFCGTLYVWGKKPGERKDDSRRVDLATERRLFGSTSVVVPCRNEARNVELLIHALVRHYDPYIKEILIVDDNSDDDTAEIVRRMAVAEPRVRLVQRRPPPGVGRALREGFAAARSTYILSTDCDFFGLVPEIRDLFDVVAAGHDGAIGSRFSYDSVLLNYPLPKIIGNRMFHLAVRLVLRLPVRDISNNLKLYRSEILKETVIEEDGFAANAETGLKPLLAGYDLREVPVSWVGRTAAMGHSSFKTLSVAPGYWRVLAKLVRRMLSGEATVAPARSRSQ
ncbi:MAG: bifunctional class I SAM-dependent methyltransferase/glycosyltransferase family 2 protein [Actinomycetota bacterium]|nr:bifunctional class I SAM-dependent methyltransferase/glycosyltransferase family 2 protein [Actinomycetota bacterium]